MSRNFRVLAAVLTAFVSTLLVDWVHAFEDVTARTPQHSTAFLNPENLVAWCIVPFDAAQRNPQQRAEMLVDLGLKRCAYDWRAQHVPEFEEEIQQYETHGIEFFAFWAEHDEAFRLFEKYKLHPQIWRMLIQPQAETQAEKVKLAADEIATSVQRAKSHGLKIGLYNHGGWGGEPENMVSVCEELHSRGLENVGIVYNFHHGHEHIANWAENFRIMQPHLICLNINGMNASGSPKILGVGKGEHEFEMLKIVALAGYDGPVGILNHREELDARDGLEENIEGTAKVKAALDQMFAMISDEDAQRVEHLSQLAESHGRVASGAALFSNAKAACLQCHVVSGKGGVTGPELTNIGQHRTFKELTEAILFPKHEVKPEYVSWAVVTIDGEVLNGYRRNVTESGFDLINPGTEVSRRINSDDIEQLVSIGTVMPDGLSGAFSDQELADVIRLLGELGVTEDAIQAGRQMMLPIHQHVTLQMDFELAPIDPDAYRFATHPINFERMFDFYGKQAAALRKLDKIPDLLQDFPGLGQGKKGHWGSQTEADWASDQWGKTDYGSMLSGILRSGDQSVTRGINLQLGEQRELSASFNPDTLEYEALWKEGFISISSVRFGFIEGLRQIGTRLPNPDKLNLPGERKYQGLYRDGQRVVFAYSVDGVDYLDSPWVDEDGHFIREVALASEHPMRHVLDHQFPTNWPEIIETQIEFGTQKGYTVDTLQLPVKNPWNALTFVGDIAFLPDGRGVVCTMQGDVWLVDGLYAKPGTPAPLRWKRFASGLHHPLGMVVVDGLIYVSGRDMITRLHDLNGDDEADYYECFNKSFETSSAGHDFICGMVRDNDGYFYIASGNQGIVKISPDGLHSEVIATGFRNPDGLGILPDGSLTVPSSEGDWTPASMVSRVQTKLPASGAIPHFGYQGPRNSQAPTLPFAYLPRGLDNSSGGQIYVDSNRWGPLDQELIHFSFGGASAFVMMLDQVNGFDQSVFYQLTGDFRSGAHRGKVNPRDGQVYVGGMNGWTCFAPDDGNFERIRYTGDPIQLAVKSTVHENGILIEFSEPVSPAIVKQAQNSIAQSWNYRYSRAYGSPEFSPRFRGVRGHDRELIQSVHVLEDGKTVFVEIPTIQPVNVLHLQIVVDESERPHDLFATIHALRPAFENFPGYVPAVKQITTHPIQEDLRQILLQAPNPWQTPIADERDVDVTAGKNLTFEQTTLRVHAGERLKLNFKNPDVVPHNWVLIRPGKLQEIGDETNKLIADPDAYLHHYVPKTDDVLVYTDIIDGNQTGTIYFQAPSEPGRYPYLCTFPGHWMVMNGVLIVEPRSENE